ncbi:MAG: dipeptidase [Aminipila sp.]
MKIIDMHCDTMLECFRNPEYKLSANSGHIDIDKLKKGNAYTQFFALFIDTKDYPQMDAYEIFNEMYNTYQIQLSLNSDILAPALSVSDILRNSEEGKISSVLAVEDGVIIDNKIERVSEIYHKGVRLVTLTWNFENSIGYPCSMVPEEHNKKLKPFGIDVISEMNRLGMIIDVSHLSEGGFYDVATHSKCPFVASHSCARALCNHQRNLTDDQLKTIGNKGGLIGVNFYSSFLQEKSEYATLNNIVDHVKYMVNKAGIEAVGLGSDFDGIDCGLEFVDYSGFPTVIDALSKHFTSDELERICNKNAFRVISEVWKK